VPPSTVSRNVVFGNRVPGLVRALAFGMIALVTSAALSGTAFAGVGTTGSVLQTAKEAIAKQPGVRVVFVASSSSTSKTEKIIADVGATSGVAAISEGAAHLAVRVTPTDAYISGNSSGLTTLFGLSAAEAKKVGADWVSWKPGTSQYSNLKSDVTLPSVTALLPKAKGTKLSTAIANGVKVYVFLWTTAATGSTPKLSSRLTVSASGLTLPIEVTTAASNGAKATTKLSKWGEDVLVSAPPAASTVASSKITG